MRKLKVAIFADFLNSLGGTEYYNVNLAILLKRNGHDVRFYIGERAKNQYWSKILEENDIPFKFSAGEHKGFLDRGPERDFVKLIKKEFEEWGPDIIHTHPFGKMMICYLELGKCEAPVIATEWTTPSSSTAHWFQPDLKKHINKAAAYIATCNAVAEGIDEYHNFQNRIEVIPHIIEPAAISQRMRVEKSMGCISRLSVEKGLDYLISAMSMLVREHPQYKLYIYGHGEDEERLKDLINCFGLNKNIVLAGVYAPFIGVNDVAAKHDIFIQPSLFESIPTSIIELMLRKRAIIATKVGGIPENIIDGQTGLLVERGDSRGLYRKMNELIENDELRKRLSKDAQNIAEEKYNQKRVFNRILDLYYSVL